MYNWLQSYYGAEVLLTLFSRCSMHSLEIREFKIGFLPPCFCNKIIGSETFLWPGLTWSKTSISEEQLLLRLTVITGIWEIHLCTYDYGQTVTHNGPNNEGLIPIRLLSYRFGLAGLEYLNHKCVCFLPWSQS